MTNLPSSVVSLKKAYVPPKQKILDPDKLDESSLERLPKPTGWRPDQTIDRESVATVCGYVLSVGSLAYKDKEKFPTGPWCGEKDWVIFGRYSGARFKIDGGEVRILNDDEVIAVIQDPEDILHF